MAKLPEVQMSSTDWFFSADVRHQLSRLKYASWAAPLTRDQMSAVLWASGEVGIQARAEIRERPGFADFRMNCGLRAIRSAVNGRPLGLDELMRTITEHGLRPETGVSDPAYVALLGSDFRTALWARHLTPDQLVALLWAIGELGYRVLSLDLRSLGEIFANPLRGNIGLLTLTAALSGRPLSAQELEEAFRVGQFPETR